MKNARIFKSFSALSFGESAPAPGVARPRPTPDSVQDFNVHTDGSATRLLTQPPGPGTTRHWPKRRILPVEFQQIKRRWLALPVSHGCPGQE